MNKKCNQILELYKEFLKNKGEFGFILNNSLNNKTKNLISLLSNIVTLKNKINAFIRINYEDLKLANKINFNDIIDKFSIESKDARPISVCELNDNSGFLCIVGTDKLAKINCYDFFVFHISKNNLEVDRINFSLSDIISINKDFLGNVGMDFSLLDYPKKIKESIDNENIIIEFEYGFTMFVDKNTKKINHFIKFSDKGNNPPITEFGDDVVYVVFEDNAKYIRFYNKKNKTIEKHRDIEISENRFIFLSNGDILVYHPDNMNICRIKNNSQRSQDSHWSLSFDSNKFKDKSRFPLFYKILEAPNSKYLYASGLYGFSKINKETLEVEDIFTTRELDCHKENDYDAVQDFLINDDGKYAVLFYDTISKGTVIIKLDDFSIVNEIPNFKIDNTGNPILAKNGSIIVNSSLDNCVSIYE